MVEEYEGYYWNNGVVCKKGKGSWGHKEQEKKKKKARVKGK